jgi:outer membrane protein assembly factor BamB
VLLPLLLTGLFAGDPDVMPIQPAFTRHVSGTTYIDVDGDGKFSAGDQPVPHVMVAYEASAFTTSDVNGHYGFYTVPEEGIMWARSPENFLPGPNWVQLDSKLDAVVDIAIRPWHPTGPLTWVNASDAHLGTIDAAPVKSALAQALAIDPPPRFLVITGDLASQTKPEEYDELADALTDVRVPWVPVPGNHDWHDEGTEWRKRFGPPQYSFDSDGVHFMVLNFNLTTHDVMDYVHHELVTADKSKPIVAFLHGPPDDDLADQLAAAGVGYLFTGHAHANRIIPHGTMLEVNTQTLAMGSLDFTPAGYRVVTLTRGQLTLEHHTVVRHPVLDSIYPRPFTCVPRGDFDLIAEAELGGGVPQVSASIDGGAFVPLSFTGGWAHSASLHVDTAGVHSLELRAIGADGQAVDQVIQFCASEITRVSAGDLGDWSQHQGAATNVGATAWEIAPPLHVAWARPLGGHLNGGAPVIADGRVFMNVVDYGDGSEGGIVALDARTGEKLWERRTGVSVHGAPAVAQGIVVFASADGVVHAADAATGAPLWDTDLAIHVSDLNAWLYAAPTIAGDAVYIGIERNFAALDLTSGAPLWTVDPDQKIWAITLASAAVADGVGVAVIGRGEGGVFAWDPRDGHELWRIPPPLSTSINASPIVDGDMVYLVNVLSEVVAVDAASGALRWSTQLYDVGGIDWGLGPTATPALADGRLIVPTPRNYLYALDATTGDELWRVAAGDSLVSPLPYKVDARAFTAPAVITGNVVWAGAADGVLRAIDARSGEVTWSSDLGSPILSGVSPAGDFLFVATYDGTLRAFAPGDPAGYSIPQPAPDTGGCDVTMPRSSARTIVTILTVLVVGLVALSRRRSRPQ